MTYLFGFFDFESAFVLSNSNYLEVTALRLVEERSIGEVTLSQVEPLSAEIIIDQPTAIKILFLKVTPHIKLPNSF